MTDYQTPANDADAARPATSWASARAAITGDSWLDAIARRSLDAAEQKFTDPGSHGPTDDAHKTPPDPGTSLIGRCRDGTQVLEFSPGTNDEIAVRIGDQVAWVDALDLLRVVSHVALITGNLRCPELELIAGRAVRRG